MNNHTDLNKDDDALMHDVSAEVFQENLEYRPDKFYDYINSNLKQPYEAHQENNFSVLSNVKNSLIGQPMSFKRKLLT